MHWPDARITFARQGFFQQPYDAEVAQSSRA